MERKAEYCLTQIFHYLVNGLAAIVFFCCIAYSGYALWDNWSILKEPDQVREDLIRYKPANEEELSYSFQELKAMNPDVCGWLTLDHTKIDYPVVQGTDNFEYLEKDVLGNPSVAGSIFLDAKSDRNFHDFYTVIMGHHMQGRKMFGDIDLYTDVSFFEKNTTGTLYVEGRILKLETVAILKADAYDKYVYRTDWKEKEEKEELIRHIYELAVHTRGQRLTVEDQMIALSTCSSGNTNGRHLLICKVIKENTVEGKQSEKKEKFLEYVRSNDECSDDDSDWSLHNLCSGRRRQCRGQCTDKSQWNSTGKRSIYVYTERTGSFRQPGKKADG